MTKSVTLFNANSLESFAVAFLEKEKGQLEDELVEGNLFDFVHQVKVGKVSLNQGDHIKIVSPMRKTAKVQEQYQYLSSLGVTVQDLDTLSILDNGNLDITSPRWILYTLASPSLFGLFDERLFSPELIRHITKLEAMSQILKVFGYKVLAQELTPDFELDGYYEGADYLCRQAEGNKYPIKYFKEKTTKQEAVLLNSSYYYASLAEVILNSYKAGEPRFLLNPVPSGKNLIIFVSYLAGSAKIKATDLPDGIQYIVREGNSDYMILPEVTVPEVVTAILE